MRKGKEGGREDEFIDIPTRRLIDSLLHDTANIVSERTQVSAVGGHRCGEMKFILMHFARSVFRR